MDCYGYIYLHKNKTNGKCYVGQSTQEPKRRFRKPSIEPYRESPAFYNALEKYTWEGFETTILVRVSNQDALNKLEEFYIKHFKSLNTQNGYNVREASEGQGKHAESTKRKQSIQKKKYYETHDAIRFGPPRKWHQFLEDGEYKHCSKCDEWKSVSCFGSYKGRTWDNLTWRCKPCHAAVTAKNRKPAKKLTEEEWKKSYIGRQKKA